MIVVKVELHSAVTGKATTLHTVVIGNVETFDEGRKAHYRTRTWKRGVELLDLMLDKSKWGKPLRQGTVESHPRKSKPVLNLVWKALTAMGYDR